MRKIIYLIVLACSLGLSLYLYYQYDQTKTRLAQANQRLADLDRQMAPIEPADTLRGEIPPASDTFLTPPPSAQFLDELGTLSSSDLDRLNRKGLQNPEADLQNDLLRKQKSLIPAQGTVGGTMAIRDVRILNDRYAMAYYEDGHNGGYMVLRFEVQPGGNISWRVVDSYVM